MDDFGIVSLPVIIVLCLLVGKVWKTSARLDDKWIPVVCGTTGLVLGVVIWMTNDAIPVEWFGIGDPWMAAAVGVVSGFASTGLHQVWKQQIEAVDRSQSDGVK